MKNIFVLTGLLLAVSSVQAAETKATSELTSASLFKNGVVVIQEEFAVPDSGLFILEQVPTPIHGTFFIESDAIVETTVTQRNVTEPFGEGQSLNYQKDLAGKDVRVHFMNGNMDVMEGKVTLLPEAASNYSMGISPLYSSPDYRVMSSHPYQPSVFPGNDNRLILDTEQGQTILAGASISRLDVIQKIDTVQRKRPVMLFNVKTDKPATIRLFYLTKGAAWAPSYRVDITNPQQLTIEQTAVVMNELRQFKEAEISLISGFPKIECENTNSPIAPGNTLAAFFQQLSSRPRPSSSPIMTQQAVMMTNAMMPPTSVDFDTTIGVAGEGPDIHFQKIGKRSMDVGDVLSLSNGKATAKYDRIVEWTIPDNRDAWGRYSNGNNQPSPGNDPWDMLRFKNPLPFPMTTGPATIVADNQFFGQNTSFWANPNETTKIPVTKSMSVRVKSMETERNIAENVVAQSKNKPMEFERNNAMNTMSQPKVVFRYGNQYREATIDVELTIINHRAESVKMFVSRSFSGELEKPVDDAKTIHLTGEELNSVNRKHEIQWEFDLPSGQTKKLTYSYTVMIND